MGNPIASFGAPTALTDGAVILADCTTGTHFTVTLGATGRTLTLVNPAAGQIVTVEVKQDATGSRTITTYNGTHPNAGVDTVAWASATAPTLTTTAAAIDVLRFTYNPTAARWIGETVSKAIG